MSGSKITVTKCLVLSMLPYLGLSMPSTKVSNIHARAGCPAGPNGPNYQTLVAGDTCQTLAEKFNTSTNSIMDLNFAGPDCTNNFIAGHQVCIPPPCNAYTVQSGDTCQKIVDSKKVAGGLDAFYAHNPDIHKPSCDNLILGSNVCLSAPDSNPAPCKAYTVQSGDTCQKIVDSKKVAGGLEGFYAYNPSVHKPSCDNLVIGSKVCVSAPGSSSSSSSSTSHPKATPPPKRSAPASAPVGTGIPASVHCTKEYTAVSGDTCQKIVDDKGVAGGLDAFYALNPTVHNPSCENLNIGQVYCVANATTSTNPSKTSAAASQHVGTGIPASVHCTKEYTAVAGDTCQKIVDDKGVAGGLDEFYAMNPTVHKPGCENLNIGQVYCVAKASKTAAASPQHVGTGIPASDHCTKEYTAVAGDTCQKIVDDKGVAGGLDAFYDLNPTVHKPGCENLNIGQVYCVANASKTSAAAPQHVGTGIPASVHCTKEYTAVGGDTCQKIVDDKGVAGGLDAFYNLNPTVHKPGCENLNIGQVYCVANQTTTAAPAKSDNGCP